MSTIACAETYHDVERMLDSLCWSFARRYGIDHEELKAHANLAFVRSYRSHAPDRASFSTWCYTIVSNALKDFLDARIRDRLRTNADRFTDTEEMTTMEVEERPKRFLETLLDELSDDARVIVRLIVESPDELSELNRTRPHPGKWKASLRCHLSYLGWPIGRVMESFSEIAEVMKSV